MCEVTLHKGVSRCIFAKRLWWEAGDETHTVYWMYWPHQNAKVPADARFDSSSFKASCLMPQESKIVSDPKCHRCEALAHWRAYSEREERKALNNLGPF